MRRWIALLALLLAGPAACGGTPSAPPAPAAPAASPAEAPAEPASDGARGADSPAAPTPAPEPEIDLDPGAADPRTLGPEATTSVGSAIDGELQGGIRLPRRGPGYRFNPAKRDEARHGTVEMIAAILHAAATVERELPGGEATIGELSLPTGGPISGHGSHQAGRDVDVLFYTLGADGAPRPAKAIPLDPAGEGTDYGDLADPADDVPVKIDVPRTWRFVQALIEHEGSEVQRIFVVEHIRALLLAEAARVKAPQATVDRFADVTCQPGFPHDDHLHIRFFCSADDIDAGCTETDPIYPWQRELMRAEGRTPVKAKARKKGSRPKLTSHAEARAKAGPMHDDVVAFLDRREAWVKQPHPGRPYCR